MSFDLTQKIKIVNPHANNDDLYGTYTSKAEALSSVSLALREIGRTVGIIENGEIKEYWFKAGISDSDLVEKADNALQQAINDEAATRERADTDEKNLRTAADLLKVDKPTTTISEPTTTFKYALLLDEDNNSRRMLVDDLGGGDSTTPLTEILYADLKTLRDNGGLIPGMQYRITDYITTTAQQDTQSAGHQFDVIVTADSASVLNENARAALHNGDTYFANVKLESWKLKYSIDNDTSRFSWADETNGKGVIHHMIDNKGNSLFYDFKNIQFKRYKITTVFNSALEESYLNTYMGLINANNLSVNTGDFIWVYTFNTEYSSSTEDDSLGNIECRGNVGRSFMTNGILELNNNTFGNNCNSNTFGNTCYSNTFGNSCNFNTFGNNCNSNTFGNTCYSNTFGNSCNFNTFGVYCGSNTFRTGCNTNTLGNNCYSNTFGSYCRLNTFGVYCGSNTLGNGCNTNTFGNSCNFNTFRTDCLANQFGNDSTYNTVGDNCSYNTFGIESTGRYFRYNHIENGCSGEGSTKDWTTQTALYNKHYSVQIFGYRTSNSAATKNTWQYYDATGTLVKGTW